MTRPAVVLLSGGLDSATTLAIARRDGFDPLALSFAYGQRHLIELDAARRVAAAFGVVEHRIIDIDLRAFGGSALTCDDLAVPQASLKPVPGGGGESPAGPALGGGQAPPGARRAGSTPRGSAIPVTYVPARNTIFLSYALALAEVRGASDIYIGVNAVDYSGYPDCRPEYVAAFERVAALATRAGVEGSGPRIHAPLQMLRKAEIVRLGLSLGVDYGLTRSCYAPDGQGNGCARCESCGLRLAAFAELGIADPAPYLA